MSSQRVTTSVDISRFYATPDEIVRWMVEEIVRNNHRPIIIAGNGPSLADIDHRRIPENAMIMRINNFYFEDKYHLGRRADLVYVAGHPKVIPDYVHTLQNVQLRKEYEMGIYLGRTNNLFEINRDYFPIVDVKKAFVTNKAIADYMTLRHMPPGVLPTSGVMALFAAVAFGFKDIYVTGIDFYTGAKAYAFGVAANHARLVGIDPGKNGYVHDYHRFDVDFEGFLVARGVEGVNIRSICPGSFLADHIELAPIVTEQIREAEAKPLNYIRDFIPVPNTARVSLEARVSTAKPKKAGPSGFEARLQSYGPVKRFIVRTGDAMLPRPVAEAFDRYFKRLGIF